MSSTITTTIDCPIQLTELTLSLSYSAGGFNATLSSQIGIPLTISSLIARGFQVCGGLHTEMDSIDPQMVLNAGQTSVSQINNGLTCSSSRFTLQNSAIVNGISVTNNSTIHIGIYVIRIKIFNTTCGIYQC